MPLAALALGGGVFAVAAWLGNVIAYGTTASTARSYGAGARSEAVAEGVQASWLAMAVGVLVLLTAQLAAGPVFRILGGAHPDVTGPAIGWLRVAAFGAPGLMLATAGNGWMRGVQDTRRPLRYVVGANLLSALLCPVLVYPVGLGLTGSAVANVVAQTVAGLLFVRALLAERVSLRPRPLVLRRQVAAGRDLLVRVAAIQACFVSAAAVAARFGVAALAAHQIALQLWMFCTLALDSVGIAAQALVGAALGARRPDLARRVATRCVVIGLAAGVLLGVVFAMDGVLIGAGDLGYLRNLTIVSALVGFLPAVWLTLPAAAGLGGIWAALTLFIVLRLVGMLLRLRTGRWATVGGGDREPAWQAGHP